MQRDQAMLDVGFIGVGTMGGRIARNLLEAGYRVRVWNRSPASLAPLARLGARPVATAREAFAGDVVFSMLAGDDAVREVLEGLIDGAPKGLVHVVLSTLSLPLVRELAARHKAQGLGYVAAPVFGRPESASAAKLTVVAAGEPWAVARAEPLLHVIGQHTWIVGNEPERANVVKLAGNFMLGAAVEAMAEAAALASRYGIAPAQLLEVLTKGVFAAPAYLTYGALIGREQYEPAGFPLSLLLDDLRLTLEAADAAAAPMPLADVVHGALVEAVAYGDADLDTAALAKVSMRRVERLSSPARPAA
jgi:3-hydroxyisobutyrate dehydrogenase-like beta-hydroxyacid dehydrogenase